MEDENPLEAKEKLDELAEHKSGWTHYLAITTAIIAVLAAIASMRSGALANDAILAKNDAILSQAKASDQWNYYQAKGIKKNLADSISIVHPDPKLEAAAAKYDADQKEIKAEADKLVGEVAKANKESEEGLKHHEMAALSVTFFQIAIALSAMAALMRQKWFWVMSLGLAVAGSGFLAASFVMR